MSDYLNRGVVGSYLVQIVNKAKLKAAREYLKSLPLTADNWFYSYECPLSFKRWVQADAKKRGYSASFSGKVSNCIHFMIDSAKLRKQQQDDDYRRHQDWINSPG